MVWDVVVTKEPSKELALCSRGWESVVLISLCPPRKPACLYSAERAVQVQLESVGTTSRGRDWPAMRVSQDTVNRQKEDSRVAVVTHFSVVFSSM